jgi:hypothetical protein
MRRSRLPGRGRAAPLLVLAALCGCSLAIPAAAAVEPPQQAVNYIESRQVTAATAVSCRFIFEYDWVDSAADARKLERALVYSGSLYDAALRFSADGSSVSGLGLVFDYDVMNDTGHGRMYRDEGSADTGRTVSIRNIAPASLVVADVTPADGSLSLDWLRDALPPQSFSSLDRIVGDYTKQGWTRGGSSNVCALGKLRLLEIRWKTVGGEAGESVVLWPEDAGGFEQAFKAVLAQSQRP